MRTTLVTIPVGKRKSVAVLAENDLWLSQRCMAEIFGTSPQNMNIHVTNLAKHLDITAEARRFPVTQTEAGRTVTRSVIHYNLEIAHAIALRAQRYDELNVLMGVAEQHGVVKRIYRVLPIRERDFAEMLVSTLDGITPVVMQYAVLDYSIDFYLPEYRLAVEYDERHHTARSRAMADKKRQTEIEKATAIRFIRIKQGQELHGINCIVKHIVAVSSRIAKE